MTTAFQSFAPLLKRAGFRKTWQSSAGGERVVEWRREEKDGRTLVCQIWSDGRHRMSHQWVGCSDTEPTGFTTAAGLSAATEREATRVDGRYRDPNNHHVPSSREFLRARQAAVDSTTSVLVDASRTGAR